MAYEAETHDREAESLGFLKTMTTLRRGRSAPSTSPANDSSRASASRGAATADPGPSVISLDVEMKGTINTPAELHIHGMVEGDIRAGAVYVCTGGSVKGDIIAENIVIAGAVEGRIFGRHVKLAAGAEVAGDIAHGSLGIDTAAVFEGTIKRYDDPMKEAAR
jgi:cytoskeletal protein CcmA (bactofilin family)